MVIIFYNCMVYKIILKIVKFITTQILKHWHWCTSQVVNELFVHASLATQPDYSRVEVSGGELCCSHHNF
jgi:hypothetical protein